jgi:hypothetical protein
MRMYSSIQSSSMTDELPSVIRASAADDPTVQPRLDLLRREWDGSYVIWFQASQFHAMRRDDGARCHRASAEDLRREMDADSRARPVFLA